MPDSNDVVGSLYERYGKTSLGLVVVITLWLTVAKPELEANRISFSQLQSIVSQQQAIVSQLDGIARTLSATAVTLERTSKLLDVIAKRKPRLEIEELSLHETQGTDHAEAIR